MAISPPKCRILSHSLAAIVFMGACPDSFGQFDSDMDCDVDLVDFANFQICFTGPGGSAGGECLIHDSDDDGDVDLAEFGSLQLAFTGPCGGINGVAGQLAGRSLPNYPFFSFERAINDDDAVEVAIDPSRYPELIGRSCDIYVIESGSAGDGLTDETPGGALTETIGVDLDLTDSDMYACCSAPTAT
jgi:hypothetical protein